MDMNLGRTWKTPILVRGREEGKRAGRKDGFIFILVVVPDSHAEVADVGAIE